LEPPLGAAAKAAWSALAALPPGLSTREQALDLVVVSIDTLRADRLPFYGGAHDTAGDPERPFDLAWLALQGTQWQEVWAPIGKTLPSLGSFWTGLAPLEHGAIDNHTPVQKATVATRLRASGWSTHAAVANRALQPAAGLAQGFESYVIRAKANEAELGATLLAATAADVAAKKRMLVWAHFMAPHQPYEPRADFRSRYTSEQALAALPEDLGPAGSNQMLEALHRDPARADTATVATVRALYDAEVRTANDYVHDFLSGLDAQYRAAGRGGLLENAVVVFFSDHGEELADHEGYFMHAKSLYSGVIRVPLLVVGPGWTAGARVDAPLAVEDILALVLDGRRPQRELFASSWKDRYYALRDGPWTLIHNPGRDSLGPTEPPQDAAFLYPQVALYHRGKDPQERVDLSAQEPTRTRAMLDALRRWYLQLDQIHPEQMQVDPATMSELGYAEGAVPDQVAILPMTGEQWKP